MARNSSGTYSLPTPGVPFQSGQTISSSQVNTTLTDIASALTDSASRTGSGNFTAPIRGPDGTVAGPAHSFVSEPGSGLYKAGTGDVRLSVAGVDFVTTSTIAFPGSAGGLAIVKPTAANVGMVVQGNKNAADTGTDILLYSTATRTAGTLVSVQNPPNTPKLNVDYQGLLQLANTAAIQPASIVTTLAPNAGWTAALTVGYWKDSGGVVHLRGGVTNNTGGVSSAAAVTLPAGFRPATPGRLFACSVGSGAPVGVIVNQLGDGAVAVGAGLPNGSSVYFDSISFLAEV